MTPDDERIQRIKQHAAHEAVPETLSGEIIETEVWEDRTILTCRGYELVVMHDRSDRRPIRFSGVDIFTLNNLNACYALLTRARDLLKGKA